MTGKQRLLAIPFILASAVYAWLMFSKFFRDGLGREPVFSLCLLVTGIMLLISCALIVALYKRAFFWSKLSVAAVPLTPGLFVFFRDHSFSQEPVYFICVLFFSGTLLSIAVFRYHPGVLLLLIPCLFLLSIMLPPVWIALLCLLYISLLDTMKPAVPPREPVSDRADGETRSQPPPALT